MSARPTTSPQDRACTFERHRHPHRGTAGRSRRGGHRQAWQNPRPGRPADHPVPAGWLPRGRNLHGHLLHHPSRWRLGPSCTTCAGHRRVGAQTRCSIPNGHGPRSRRWSTWRRSATRRRSGSATAVERCDPDRGRGFSGSGRSRKWNGLAALDVPHPVPDAPPVDLRPEVRQR